MSSRPVYLMCAQVAPSGECLRGKGPPDRIVGKTWCRLFLAAYLLCTKPGCCCCPAWQCVCWVIAALHGRLLYVVRFVLTTLNEDYYCYYYYFFTMVLHSQGVRHCYYYCMLDLLYIYDIYYILHITLLKYNMNTHKHNFTQSSYSHTHTRFNSPTN